MASIFDLPEGSFDITAKLQKDVLTISFVNRRGDPIDFVFRISPTIRHSLGSGEDRVVQIEPRLMMIDQQIDRLHLRCTLIKEEALKKHTAILMAADLRNAKMTSVTGVREDPTISPSAREPGQ